MIVPVMLKDGTEELVDAKVLDRLLEEGRVAFFRRADGWVVVDEGPLRGMGGRLYAGRERREGLRSSRH